MILFFNEILFNQLNQLPQYLRSYYLLFRFAQTNSGLRKSLLKKKIKKKYIGWQCLICENAIRTYFILLMQIFYLPEKQRHATDFKQIDLSSLDIYNFKDTMQALQFPRGNIYQLVGQESNQALRIQATEPHSYDKSRIVGVAPNPNDLGQLWMIEKVGHGDDEFEIVNGLSNLVWDEEGSEIKLRFGKQSKDQLFKVEKFQNNSFWFKTSAKGDQAVALEGVLRYKKFDPNVLSQLFYIVPVNNSTALNETAILVNANSGKAVDIPGATFEHGERLIQYEKNKRFNQRWRWVKQGAGYILQSLLNGQALDIAEEKKTSGSKVVQWDKTGNSNQLWAPVPAGAGVWKIKSIHAPGQFLAIKDDDVNDGGKLEINNGDGQGAFWRIQGFVPTA